MKDPSEILLAEDAYAKAAGLAGTLECLGYTVIRTAPSGTAILEKAATETPALVLTDIFMEKGETEGTEVARQLRTRQGIPTLFLTSGAGRRIAEKAGLARDVYDCLTRPVRPRQLENAIEAVLYKNRVRQETEAYEMRCRMISDRVREWEFWRMPDGRFSYVSPSSRRVTGCSSEELLRHPDRFMEIIRQEDRAAVSSCLEKKAPESADTACEFRIVLPTGESRWIRMTCRQVFGADGTWLGWRGNGRDITDLTNIRKEIDRLSGQDMLTRLISGETLLKTLTRRLSGGPPAVPDMAVILADLDNFSEINGRFGHSFGDEVLRETARRLSACIRASDMVARTVANEFAVVLEDIPASWYACAIADKIIRALSAPIFLNGRHCTVTVSIGISLYPADGPDVETLMRKADIAMSRAKKKGKNTYFFYESCGVCRFDT
ncbi:two-component system response regulator [Desulfonema ishimotonii]|uniref:Two-component system response regulator n=1 Tax=Desulfonema ishimotonii TaxID=45657 RepID=A0A401FUA0_9BACT|nr:diguanylate cyclase [Desulfonema ishimotonii]GBC60546.1 two-component system response regulator [Desulfonema ishimotonii]